MIGQPEIPGAHHHRIAVLIIHRIAVLVLLLYRNPPVHFAAVREFLFPGTPAVAHQPRAVPRRLMLRKEVLLRVIVVPSDNGDRVIGKLGFPGIVRPGHIVQVDACFRKILVRAGNVRHESDGDAAFQEQLFLDQPVRFRIVCIRAERSLVRGTGQQDGFFQVIVPGKTVFLGNGPVVRVAVAEIAVLAHDVPLNGVLFLSVVPEKIAVCFAVLIRRPDPLGVGGGRQERIAAGIVNTLRVFSFRHKALAVLRVVFVRQRHMGKINHLLFRKVDGLPRVGIIVQDRAQDADLRRRGRRESPAGPERILLPHRRHIAPVPHPVSVRIDAPQVKGFRQRFSVFRLLREGSGNRQQHRQGKQPAHCPFHENNPFQNPISGSVCLRNQRRKRTVSSSPKNWKTWKGKSSGSVSRSSSWKARV